MQLGKSLRAARERAGVSQAAAATRAGLGESSVSEFENDRRQPSLAQLNALARAYSTSVAKLMDDQPTVTPPVLWRDKPSVGAEELEAKFLRLAEQYANLERWSGDHRATSLPVDGIPKKLDRNAAEEMARTIRQRLALGDRPALSLLRVLEEDYGVKVFHMPFEPTGTAACARSEQFGDAILLNSKNTRWRRNYDLAHELFHLLTWNIFRSKSPTTTEDEERLADTFASVLLLPDEAVRSAVNRRLTETNALTVPMVFEVAREFDVSIDALIWRLHNLYGVVDAEYTRGRLNLFRRAGKLYEPREPDSPPTRPDRFGALAIAALRAGEISIGRCAEYLGISRGEAMKFMEEEAIADETLELPAP